MNEKNLESETQMARGDQPARRQAKSKEVKPSDEWWCETCGTELDKSMSRPDMLKHLQEKHGIDTKNLKGKRQMLMHIDGDTWFSWQWAFTFDTPKGEVKLTNSTVQPRAKDDMMRFA